MDVFAVDWANFHSLGPIEGIESITWIERYNQPGEFTIIGNPVPLMSNLPLGKFISTSTSEEVMVVETHYIDETQDNPNGTKLVVTGTSITDYIMKNRVVSYNLDYAATDIWDYEDHYQFSHVPLRYDSEISTTYIGQLLVNIINNHLKQATGLNENLFNMYTFYIDLNTYFEYASYVSTKMQYLNELIYDLLLGTDLGLKSSRPGPNRKALEDAAVLAGFDIGEYPDQNIFFIFHAGNDVSETAIFNTNDGHIHDARYFWSNKNEKNAFYSANRDYAQRTFFDDFGDDGGWFRKVLKVDLDGYVPYDQTTTDIWGTLNGHGEERLRESNAKGFILDAKGSKTSGPKYGIHYRVGDVVKVFGNYGINQNMRVSEVAIFQDGNEVSAIPTLRAVYKPPGSPPG